MLGLFSRRVRRPHDVRCQFRTVLRLESLELRATPAANLLTSLTFNGGHAVVLTGQVVVDEGGDGSSANGGASVANNVAVRTGKPAVAPGLSNVTISQSEDGTWHIKGHVDGGAPIGTIIQVVSGPGNTAGSTATVDADGNFDLGVQLDPGTPGGAITINAINQTTGTTSDPWTGLIG